MSVNQQDLDPDSTTDVEVVTDTEEELIKECEEMWKDMEECQNKLSLIGAETLTDSNAQLSLLIMQVKCLTAELSQWQKETPKIAPLNDDVLVTLGKEEFQKLQHDLEMVLSTIQSKNEKLKEDLQREQQWLDEQQQIMESLNVLHSELKNQVVTFSESRIFTELKTKMLNVKKYKKKLLITLGEFLEDHFPLPDGSVKKKKAEWIVKERDREKGLPFCRWFTLQWPLRPAHRADAKAGARCFSWSPLQVQGPRTWDILHCTPWP
ncbi:centromere protein K isoform X2 [Lepus europaeus]|uniref:centromere protein K isoform X2 n=1 Tax=Lepus europaeus TaxID=9983 RepID=UPI002B497D81|nr:centromere protein K isoform X2 [Lepus europaeus]